MKNGLKMAVIGGGSSYTPELVEGIIKRTDELPVRQLWLVDIEEGKEKLEIITGLARRMIQKSGVPIEVIPTLERRRAIENADFIVTQFRVGGLKAREKDETIPLKYDLIGQETTGAGGFAKALRTIPVILDICREIEELSPDAWLINFTNPAGIITEAVLNHSRVKAIGLCNVPISMVKDIAAMLEVDPKRIYADFTGLNHMNYITAVYLDGKNIINELIEMYDKDYLKEKLEKVSDVVWDIDFIKALRMIPSPYHRYFYLTRKMLNDEKESMKTGGARAVKVQEIEKKLFELYKNEELNEKPKELEKRGGAYYAEAAVSLISAIYNNKNEIHTVNILNNGTITNLPDNAVIEVNALIGKNGARPFNIGKAPVSIAGLINCVKSYEQLTIQAAVNKDYYTALMALNANPLVADVDIAAKVLDELIDAHRPYLDYIRKNSTEDRDA